MGQGNTSSPILTYLHSNHLKNQFPLNGKWTRISSSLIRWERKPLTWNGCGSLMTFGYDLIDRNSGDLGPLGSKSVILANHLTTLSLFLCTRTKLSSSSFNTVQAVIQKVPLHYKPYLAVPPEAALGWAWAALGGCVSLAPAATSCYQTL